MKQLACILGYKQFKLDISASLSRNTDSLFILLQELKILTNAEMPLPNQEKSGKLINVKFKMWLTDAYDGLLWC